MLAVDAPVTVNYTHLNGTQWTETYKLSDLKSHAMGKGVMLYDLPFSFTEEHPNVTDVSEIGQAIITAQVVMQTLAALPTLHDYDLDLAARDEASRVSLNFDSPDLTEVDDDASAQGVDMKDSGKAFDKFNFQLPPVLPFTVNVERDGDYFIIRACMEKNFLPGVARC